MFTGGCRGKALADRCGNMAARHDGMKLHQLKALVAIADHGSLRAAARAAQVSPAAISKAVRELEDALRTRLVLRQSQGAGFTEAGRVLLVHARLAVEQLARAEHEISALAGGAQQLRVGVAAWLAMTCLGDVVLQFQHRMPGVRLEFFEGALTVAIPRLRDGTLDCYIGPSPPPPLDADFTLQPMFRTTSAVVARQGHPLAGSRSLAQLAGAQWLRNWSPAEHPVADDDVLGRFLVDSGAVIHVVHAAVIAISLVRSTDMLSVMPWPLIEAVAAREQLCVLPLGESFNDAATSLVWRRGEPLGAAARCFVDCFTEVMRKALQSDDPARRRLLHSIDTLSLGPGLPPTAA